MTTDIWSGDIFLSDHEKIEDIILASQNIASYPSISAPTLRFLATVDTARIPLYLAAGPSLDVYTTSEATQAWFESQLLYAHASADGEDENREWWTCARSQSPVGILVQVEDTGSSDEKAPRVTEILFYGTIAASADWRIPTPPPSSQEWVIRVSGELPELRVHALPLSSDLLHRRGSRDAGPISPLAPGFSAVDVGTGQDAQFLPSPFAHTPVAVEPDSPKRKRDIFEESIQLQKRNRRKGGQGVSAAAAKAADMHAPLVHRRSMSIDPQASSLSNSRPGSSGGLPAKPSSRRSSRSPSVSSDTLPRKSLLETKRPGSTLSQVATVPVQPEEPTLETRNKEALSRVVLAAMRMYGLQQRKKNRSRRASLAPGVEVAEQQSEEAAAEEAAKDEEYKLIYHQTYKGAALALRKHIPTQPLHLQPDRLEDVVDKLLTIFCTDPLAPPPPPPPSSQSQSVLATPGQERLGFDFPPLVGSTHGRASPFDLPSGNRALLKSTTKMNGSGMNTGSPVSRRRVEGVGVKMENVKMEGG